MCDSNLYIWGFIGIGMEMKGVLVLVLVLFGMIIFGVYGVFGIGITTASVSDTTETATVSSASNLYSYEVNYSIDSGSVSGTDFTNFLTSDGALQSTGHNIKNGYVYVYATRLDADQDGITGGGELFTVTHSGGLTLRGLLAIDKDGSIETVSYNVPSTDSTTGGGGTSVAGTAETPTPTLSAGELARIDISTDRDEGINTNVFVGKEKSEEVTVRNDGPDAIALTFEVEGLRSAGGVLLSPSDGDSVVSFEMQSVVLQPGEEKTVILDIDNILEPGLLTGNVLIKSSGTVLNKIPVLINPRSENFLFDTSLVISDQSRKIASGGTVQAQFDLFQVAEAGIVDVVATYVIKDFKGNTYFESSETFAVLDEKSLIKEFDTTGLPGGEYVLAVEVVYPGAFATSSYQFEVESGAFGVSTGLLIVLGIAILVVLIVIVWAVRGRRKVGKKKK